MEILQLNTELQLIMWQCRNWQGGRTFVVAYGLQVKQFDCPEKAEQEYRECKAHSLECN
jgi:hypothetical protein